MSARSRRLARERGRPWSAAKIAGLVARKAVRLEELERDVSVLFPGAADAIRAAAGAMPIAIASGARGAEIRRVLDSRRLADCFTAIVAAEDTPVSKPAPDPVPARCGTPVAGAATACAPPSASRSRIRTGGCESARAAGLRTVAVTNTYRADELTADLTITSLHDMDLDACRVSVPNNGINLRHSIQLVGLRRLLNGL